MAREGINTVILSFSPAADSALRETMSQRAVDSLAGFGVRNLLRIRLNGDTHVLTACSGPRIAMDDNLLVILHGCAVVTRSGEALQASHLAARFARSGEAFVDELEPPFLVLSGDSSGATAATDSVGLVHAFSHQDGAVAALATSAALLARTFALPLSPESVFQSMTIGHRLDDSSGFSGATAIPPAARARIGGGRITVQRRPPPLPAPPGDPVGAGRQAIVTAVGRCLAAVPDCGIELSGGLDSRMALAAIPRDLRTGRKAYTIGYPGSRDIEIAGTIAKQFAMQHVVVDLSAFDAESMEATWRRARRVACRDDFSTNVIDRLAIDCVDDQLLGCPRVGGVNGELARGFYYAMLGVHEAVSEASVDTLLRYRLALNDAAPRELFTEQDQRSGAAALRARVADELGQHRHALGVALDAFYLRQRMRHWAGSGISRAAMNRVILTPFFHDEYMAWSMGLPLRSRQNSAGFCTVLADLDRQLASIPLDSMMTPLAQSGVGVSARLTRLRTQAGKLAFKIAQRFGLVSTRTVGSRQFVRKLSHPELLRRVDWHGLSRTELFSDEGLERLRTGTLPPTRTSLGHILSIHFLLGYLDAPACSDVGVAELRLPESSRQPH